MEEYRKSQAFRRQPFENRPVFRARHDVEQRRCGNRAGDYQSGAHAGIGNRVGGRGNAGTVESAETTGMRRHSGLLRRQADARGHDSRLFEIFRFEKDFVV